MKNKSEQRHCSNGGSCMLGKMSQGPSGYCDCCCEICLGIPIEEETVEKTGCDKWIEEQMQNPDFKRAYEETLKQLKK